MYIVRGRYVPLVQFGKEVNQGLLEMGKDENGALLELKNSNCLQIYRARSLFFPLSCPYFPANKHLKEGEKSECYGAVHRQVH